MDQTICGRLGPDVDIRNKQEKNGEWKLLKIRASIPMHRKKTYQERPRRIVRKQGLGWSLFFQYDRKQPSQTNTIHRDCRDSG
jgi:hypothetical protein